MDFIQAVVLGIVQGLAEFLPISSSAHLSIVGKLMGFEVSGDEGAGFAAFSAVIQFGTELAIILFFAKDIGRILKAWFISLPIALRGGPNHTTSAKIGNDARMGWLIILGTIPIVVCGIVLKNPIETVFRTLWVTAFALIIVGIIMALTDAYMAQNNALEDIHTKSGFLVGLAQICALIPGVSRSGATITAGRAMGFTREAAAKFSFYLAIPSILGAAIFELKGALDDFDKLGFPGWTSTITATVVSFIVGYFVIAAFMKMISKISLKGFAYYRIVLGVVVIMLLSFGVITA